MSASEIDALIANIFPQIHAGGQCLYVDDVTPGVAQVRLEPRDEHLRPGGTVSGPSLFSLVDVAAYVVVMGHIGPVALAVTTNCNINFLRKPEMRPLVCTASLIKLGKRLCVVEAGIRHVGEDDLVAHATLTYSVPPR